MKFIYFDVGNVFMTFDKIFTKVCSDFSLDYNEFCSFYDQFDVDANLGKTNIPEVWTIICQHFKIKDGGDYQIIKSWISDYEAILPMHEIASLIQNKYQIGILSNYYRDYFQEATSQNFIPKLNFSPVIISAEVGCKKPEAEIYQIAETKCGFTGSDIFFIDDKQENLDEAASHGWQTFLFDYKNPQESVDKLRSILLPTE